MEIFKNKVFQVVFSIGVITWFSYTMYDAFKNNNRPPRLSEAQRREAFIKGMIRSSELLSNADSSIAIHVASCFYDDFVAKYGYEKLAEWDAKYLKGDTAGFSQIITPVFNKCQEPFAEKLRRPKNIIGCVNTVLRTSTYTRAQAESYCSCFYDYLSNKYGPETASNPSDSLLQAEATERRKCLEAAVQANTATAQNP